MDKKKTVALIIWDGYGIAPKSDANAAALANTPYMDYLLKTYPSNQLQASEEAVGLPEGQMGNSEVGHLNLGAGRVVYQSLTRINVSIKNGTFFKNQTFLDAVKHAKKYNSKLHIMGLCSDGGVHAHTSHIKALLKIAKDNGIFERTYLHVFLDGRDTPQKSGLDFLKNIITDTNCKIATVSGRFYAMDRDNNWDRLQKTYDAMLQGNGELFSDALEGIQHAYNNNLTDEFVVPFIVDKNGLINDDDAIIFANFRPDRAIRLATALSNPKGASLYITEGKSSLDVSRSLQGIFFVSMMHYNSTVKGELAFQLQTLDNLYGEVLANNHKTQLRIAETEKYAHVTFFFDGGKEREFKGADRILVQSPDVATYDLQPEMNCYELRDKAVEAVASGKYDSIILNFANPDMVGHTGNTEAAIKAVEAVDACTKNIVEELIKNGGIAVVIADHGNCEKMRDENGAPHTAHTTNLVPIIITKHGLNIKKGALCDVAPTLLELLNINKPSEMTGTSLIVK